ncbi:hypothetical protein [Streptomyces sp. NPDC015130]|uniref:hypothetical protein n=1 Tax=Streptomyces sp. NPDC015130 TaxID=3364940 RepID=UPI003702E901
MKQWPTSDLISGGLYGRRRGLLADGAVATWTTAALPAWAGRATRPCSGSSGFS